MLVLAMQFSTGALDPEGERCMEVGRRPVAP